jgi:hypothetical protein
MKFLVLVSSFLAYNNARLATAFGPALVGRTATTTCLFQAQQHLNEVDEMCIENVAQLCLDAQVDGCDLEEYEALVNQLTEQKAYHVEQVELLEGLLGQLQGATIKDAAAN